MLSAHVLDPTPDLPVRNTFIEFSSTPSSQVRQRTCPPCVGWGTREHSIASWSPRGAVKVAAPGARWEDVSTGDESSAEEGVAGVPAVVQAVPAARAVHSQATTGQAGRARTGPAQAAAKAVPGTELRGHKDAPKATPGRSPATASNPSASTASGRAGALPVASLKAASEQQRIDCPAATAVIRPAASSAPARKEANEIRLSQAEEDVDAWTEVPTKKDRRRRGGASDLDALVGGAAVPSAVAPATWISTGSLAMATSPPAPALTQGSPATPLRPELRKPASTVARPTKCACRFLVGIQDEPSFKVVKRLLGPGGEHLKLIVEGNGGVKLSLRGQGSRCLEGSANVESSDPLMVCVSAPSQPSLDLAATKLGELLEAVHVSYREFCAKRGAPVPLLEVRREAQNADELERLLRSRGGGR